VGTVSGIVIYAFRWLLNRLDKRIKNHLDENTKEISKVTNDLKNEIKSIGDILAGSILRSSEFMEASTNYYEIINDSKKTTNNLISRLVENQGKIQEQLSVLTDKVSHINDGHDSQE